MDTVRVQVSGNPVPGPPRPARDRPVGPVLCEVRTVARTASP